MDQNQAQIVVHLFPIIFQAVTAIAALLAAAAAFHAAGKSSKTAVYQSYFDKKAESYDEYWKAFTAFVFHPNVPDTRRTLIAAMYSACMYASDDTARNIKAHTDIALKRDWMLSNGIEALDSISLEVIDILQRDLQSTDLPNL